MRVLIVVPNPKKAAPAIQSWKSRLQDLNQLSVLALAGSETAGREGYDFHYLDLSPIGAPTWHPVLVRAFAYLPHAIRPLWPLIVKEFWSDLYWSFRSFDPDLVDLRWMPGDHLIKSLLEAGDGMNVLVDGETPPDQFVTSSRRRYTSDLKVSIVLPVHNGEDYVSESILSCLKQTHKELELVIVDDCSTDRTSDIVRKFAKTDSRIQIVRNRSNLGLPESLNRGFRLASGKFLTWTSHDNLYSLNAIEELVRYLCSWDDVDLVYASYRIVDEGGRPISDTVCPSMPWHLRFDNIVGPCFLYRREVYEKVGDFRTRMEYAEDYDYWARVAERFTMAPLHQTLYTYRRHAESMSALGRPERAIAARRVRQEHFGPDWYNRNRVTSVIGSNLSRR